MIIAIHQPNYLPYLGFFDKIKKSDLFVIHNDSQFSRKDFHHRNRIRTQNRWSWLTVPVKKEEIPINKIKIKNEPQKNKPPWYKIHLREIHANYAKTEYFGIYEADIKKIYEKRYENLVNLNMDLIKFLMKAFNLDRKIIISSSLDLKSQSTEKLIDIIEALGGDTYLSGSGGRNYMDISLFEKVGIKIEFQDYKHPKYKQRYDGFEPNMAAIDALFNVGKIPA